MIEGIDLSHWNHVSDDMFRGIDFLCHKLTEGKSMEDKEAFSHTLKARNVNRDIILGYYHYARPEYNTAEQEAIHFCKTLREVAMSPCFLALDWEGVAEKHDPQWALDWLDYVYIDTGIRPLIYCNASMALKMSFLYEENYGLWVAHWNRKKPLHKGWPFWAMWQYTAKPYDKDRFNGERKQLLKYCGTLD